MAARARYVCVCVRVRAHGQHADNLKRFQQTVRVGGWLGGLLACPWVWAAAAALYAPLQSPSSADWGLYFKHASQHSPAEFRRLVVPHATTSPHSLQRLQREVNPGSGTRAACAYHCSQATVLLRVFVLVALLRSRAACRRGRHGRCLLTASHRGRATSGRDCQIICKHEHNWQVTSVLCCGACKAACAWSTPLACTCATTRARPGVDVSGAAYNNRMERIM